MESLGGNVLDWPVLVHQINCLTTEAHGLSRVIANRFPWANVYAERESVGGRNLATPETRGRPGEIEVRRRDGQVVVGLLGQWDFGGPRSSARPGRPGDHPDTQANRLEWFRAGLNRLAEWVEETRPESVAFPYQIGCGLACGDWARYSEAIDEFAARAPTRVVVVALVPLK